MSRLSGYNLFPYFERWGFLRQVNQYIGDYGDGWSIFTKDMYDEFESDMNALNLKTVDDNMLKDMFYQKDLFEVEGSGFGTTPTIPN